MDIKYMIEGYNLMIQYLREQRILTKERKFRRKLEKFYTMHKNQNFLNLEEEKEYLKLEQYFFNNILQQKNNKEKAYVNFLNIITDASDNIKE